MADQRIVVGLDIGTSKVCTLIGEVRGEEVQVVGIGITPSRGIRKGIVVSMDDAAAAISSSIKKAETFSGYRIVGAYVAVSGGHLASQSVHEELLLSAKRPVSRQDLSEALDLARPDEVPEGRRILHLLPKAYVLDGEDGVRNPVGMMGTKLEVEALLVTAGTAPLQNLAWCVERAGVALDGLVAAGVASAYAALTDVERQLGVLLIDMGGGSTDLVWVSENEVQFVGALPFGGNHVTADLSTVLGVPFAAAEELKVRFGSALPLGISEDDRVDAGSAYEGEEKLVSRRLVCEVIEARLSEILSLAMDELTQAGFKGVLPAGVVLTGAGSQLRGLREVAQDMLGAPARIGQPEGLGGQMDTVVNPAYSTSVGLLKWVLAQPGDLLAGRPVRKSGGGLGGRLRGIVRAFLP